MIKNIIFDFGGVLYNLDFKNTFTAFEELGFKDFENNMFSQHSANLLFKELETGKIAPSAFYDSIKILAHKPISTAQIRDAWNAMLLGYRTDSLDFLQTLRSKYNLYLLSNTNQIHYDYFTHQIKQQTSYSSLNSFFINAYYSQLIGLRKPDREVFEFVLTDSGINADETLFIDDSHSNFPNAEKIGIKTHLLQPAKLIENIDYDKY